MSAGGWFASRGLMTVGGQSAPPPSAPPSATAPPATAAPSSQGSWFAEKGLTAGQTPPAAASPVSGAGTAPLAQGLTDNPKGEGLYPMTDKSGQPAAIPYSNVQRAASQGYRFANQKGLEQYARDHAAQPIDENRVQQFYDQLPWYDPAKMTANILAGAGAGVEKTLAGADQLVSKLSGERTIEPLQEAAATPTKGGAQAAGEAGENVGEFFGGEELLSMFSKALPLAERMKQATGMASILQRNPTIAKILRIGASAVKQGTVATGQNYVKSGGDFGGSLLAGGVTAATSGALAGAADAASSAVANRATTIEDIGGVPTPVPAEVRNAAEVPQQSAGKQAIAGAAKSTAGSVLDQANVLRKGTPLEINVPKVVEKVGSFSDARDQLDQAAEQGYNALNAATDGQFSKLRQAGKDAWQSWRNAITPEQQKAAKDALDQNEQKISTMFDGLKGKFDPKTLDSFNQTFKNARVLDQVSAAVDGSFAGNPSASARSWEQRGFDGNQLMRSLSRLERQVGRSKLEQVIGGDNLDTLYQVAELNRTNAQRAKFGAAVEPVKQALFQLGRHAGWGTAGAAAAHAMGASPEAGAFAGVAAGEVSKKVMNAILTRPQIARSLIFALDSGARPENYGPYVATLIEKAERANQEDDEQNGNQ